MAAMTAPNTESPELTGTDRCDRCGAQALVRVVLTSGELLFCGHHYREYGSTLRDVAIDVIDETERLRPS
jgi:hypothetical protein